MINNAEDLKKVLAEEIEGVRKGTTTAKNANAITQLAGKLINLVKLEMEYNHSYTGFVGDISFLQSEQKKLVEK